MIRVLLTLVFVLLSVGGSEADPAAVPVLTLPEALQRSLENSPDIATALSRVRQARIRISETYVPYNPTVTLTANYVRNLVPPPTSGSGGNDFLTQILGLPVVQGPRPILDTYQGLLAMRDTVYSFGRAHWTVSAARLSRRQAAQECRAAVEVLLAEVGVRYVEAQQAQVLVRLAEERQAERQRFLVTAEKLFKGGDVASFDVLQYRASLHESERALLAARNDRKTAESVLLSVVGMPAWSAITLQAPDLAEPPPPSLEAGLRAASERRPELRALRWAVQAAQANVRAAALQSAPTLNVVSNSAWQNAGGHFWNAGLTLDIPVLDGGAARYQRQQADEAVLQARQNLEKARRSAELDVTRAFESMQSLWAQIEVAKEALADAQHSMTIAERRYREGVVSSSIELLNVADATIAARDAFVRAHTQYRIARIQWDRAISAPSPVVLPGAWHEVWEEPSDPHQGPPAPASEVRTVPTPLPGGRVP